MGCKIIMARVYFSLRREHDGTNNSSFYALDSIQSQLGNPGKSLLAIMSSAYLDLRPNLYVQC